MSESSTAPVLSPQEAEDFVEERIESFGLSNSAWKSVEEKSFCLRIFIELFLEHRDGDFIGHKRSTVHDFFHFFAKRSIILGMPAK